VNIRSLHASGSTPTMIATVTGIPRTTIRDYINKQLLTVSPPVNEAAEALNQTTALRPEIVPLNIEVPPPVLASVSDSTTITALLYGDIHFPHQDDEGLSIVRQIAFLLQPDVLCNMGDMLDCTSLSRFDKDPAALESIQDEIDLARVHLAQMRQLSPLSRVVLLEGNHEDRLRRTLWGMKGEASVLNKLTKFQELMTWPALLDLDALGVEFVPYGQQSKFDFLPKFILKHGDTVRGYSAYTARGEMEKYNFSGASGHTHRLGQYFRRDRNGAHVWIETGCCCSLTPQYVADPNWQNGCVVLTFERETGAVHAELINIVNGMAVWRGNVLRA
jgi:calcineurin-like phosphoesterase family protein